MPEAGAPLRGPDPAEDRALLFEAARSAGEVALSHRGRAPRRWEKPEGAGPVSEADLAVNEALSATLRRARPDYGWLSEEDPDGPDRLGARRVFVVDPIDGTRAYLAGEPGFAVAVAVVEAGRPVAGVVHLPARGESYAAHLGGGAARHTAEGAEPVAPSGRTRLSGAAVLAPKSALAAEHWEGGALDVVRHVRSALAWRLCLVAAGRFDAVLTLRPAWEWDIAAAALVAEEAGCRVSDAEGRPLAFNRATPRAPSLVAAGPALHAAILAQRRAG